MSPISTAQLNPHGQTFCFGPPGTGVLVPILLNNTEPFLVKYSLVPLGYVDGAANTGRSRAVGKVEHRELSRRDLKSIEEARIEGSQLARPSQVARDVDEYDEYDDDDDNNNDNNDIGPSLQATQSLHYIRLTKPGTLRLERVLDASHTDARIMYPAEVTVAPCPRVEFMDDRISSHEQHMQCAGQDPDLELMIAIHGVPPLSLRWYKEVNGNREHFLVEGIEGGHEDHDHTSSEVLNSEDKRPNSIPRDLKVPLSVSLGTLGTHAYVLEEVVDGFGNIVHLSPETSHESRKSSPSLRINSQTVRSLSVLRRPTFSFNLCGPGNPTSFLIGSEAPLTISAIDADPQDAPWDITLKYSPPPPMDGSNKSKSKRFKPWQRTTQTQNNRKDMVVRANAPGEYTIVSVKGKVSIVLAIYPRANSL
jgi:nucleoporin POM152